MKAAMPPGTRVQMTDLAIASGFYSNGKNNCQTGVVGRHLEGDLIRVKRDGRKQSEQYHVMFWEPIPEQK